MSKKTRKRNKNRKIVFLLSFFLVAVLLLGGLSLTVLFKTKNVKISGSTMYTSEEILSATAINNEDNLFMLNEKDILKRVQKQLPFIEELTISRKLPDTAIIKVKDVKFVIRFSNETQSVLSDTSYRIVPEFGEDNSENLTVIANWETDKNGEYVILSEEDSLYIENILSVIKNNSIKISTLDISDSENIKMIAEERFEVNFGNKYDFSGKFSQLIAMINNIESEKTGRIDLSEWSKDNTKGYFVEGEIF